MLVSRVVVWVIIVVLWVAIDVLRVVIVVLWVIKVDCDGPGDVVLTVVRTVVNL